MPDRAPVIVGTGLSDYPQAPHLDGVQHHAQAMQRAEKDARTTLEEWVKAHKARIDEAVRSLGI